MKRKLKGTTSIEYIVLLVCIALAALLAFGLLGKTTGVIINNTKDVLINKVDNAASESLNSESQETFTYTPGVTFTDGTFLTWDEFLLPENGEKYGYNAENLLYDNAHPTIASCGLMGNQYITSIAFPEGVEIIGQAALYNCPNLTSIIIPSSLLTIGYGNTEDCSNLTSIRYIGTVAKWNQVLENSYWGNPYTGIEVICSDGTAGI